MAKIIELDVKATNPFVLEELLDNQVIKSVIIIGKKGFELPNVDILEVSFSRWIIKLVASDNLTDEDLQNYKIKTSDLCKDMGFTIYDIYSYLDDTKYNINGWDSNTEIKIANFVIVSDIHKFQDLNKIKVESKTIPIFVNSSQAFGTGRHETTYLCMEALCNLKSQKCNFKNILDMGTGSAILSIISAHLWKDADILAVDIDDASIKTAKHFTKINGLDNKINLAVSNGFMNVKSKDLDLIIANILLNPLKEMAKDFYNHLSNGGHLLVSGFLDNQTDSLIKTTQNLGFILQKITFKENEQQEKWACALLIKQ